MLSSSASLTPSPTSLVTTTTSTNGTTTTTCHDSNTFTKTASSGTIISSTLEKHYDAFTGQKLINQYKMVKEIGRGVHGKVKLAQNMTLNTFVAVKIIDKQHHHRRRQYSLLRASSSNNTASILRDYEKSIRREMMILQKCHHPNIIQLLEIIDDPQCRKIYMVLDYMEGGAIVWRDEQERPILSRKESRRMFKDIVNGLDYLHGSGIIHRDIKPANLLLTKNQVVKISDFGVSFDATSDDSKWLLETVGTPAFFAPELCAPQHYNFQLTPALDIWSLGVTLYCFLFGACPFMAPTEYELFELIPSHTLTYPYLLHTSLTDLLNGLLTKDPSHRITLQQVQIHPWVINEDIDNDQENERHPGTENPNDKATEMTEHSSLSPSPTPSLVSLENLPQTSLSSPLPLPITTTTAANSSLTSHLTSSSLPSPPSQKSPASISSQQQQQQQQRQQQQQLPPIIITTSCSSPSLTSHQQHQLHQHVHHNHSHHHHHHNRHKPSITERLRMAVFRFVRRHKSSNPSTPKATKQFSRLRPLSCFSDISL